MADMTQAADVGAPDAPDTDDSSTDMSKGFVIEITCTPDGKFAVGVEPLSEESSEESGAGEDAGDSEDTQQVGSVGEVCKLVREIVSHAGQIADTGADADAMSAGYGPGA